MTLSLGADRHFAEGTAPPGVCQDGLPDAERAAAYLVRHVAARAGVRLRQGAWAPSLATRPLGGDLELVATTRLRAVSRPVAEALVAWGEGRRRVHLLERVPSPWELLALQAKGERCVSILADDVPTAPHEDGLAFVMHDLCHLEKFVDPEHHAGQVGFFAVVHAATTRAGWNAFFARFDDELLREVEHVVADMNGSAVFLFAALKMKLKMGVRRRLARELGREVKVEGPLDEDEAQAFDEALGALLDLLGMTDRARDAAFRVSTRRDERDAAVTLLDYFESVGSETLAAR